MGVGVFVAVSVRLGVLVAVFIGVAVAVGLEVAVSVGVVVMVAVAVRLGMLVAVSIGVAVDVLVQQYFRKAGVTQTDPSGAQITDDTGQPVLGPERDARQVFDRLAGCWTHWGREHGYFDTDDDAQAFHDELCYMLSDQFSAPNTADNLIST